MIVWPAKDPDEVTDYSWNVPLDSGDAISSYTVTRTSGDVTLDSDSNTDTAVTVWLSGGTDASSSTFTLRAVTDGGRTFEETATISIVSSANSLTAAFLARYPAFAAVPSQTIAYWIADAQTIVGTNWPTDQRDAGVLTYAAHSMAENGIGVSSGAAQGVTGFKSGTFSVQQSDAAANRTGLSATIYGRQYLDMCRRVFGGARLVVTANHV